MASYREIAERAVRRERGLNMRDCRLRLAMKVLSAAADAGDADPSLYRDDKWREAIRLLAELLGEKADVPARAANKAQLALTI